MLQAIGKRYFFLTTILLLAIFLRFWNLGVNPPSLTWDEASWGYNAYSLGIDGRDEFGRFLPLDYLESFGDFKPPLYAYLDIVPVKLFGLSEFAVRFPSAFFGVLTVLITYFLTKRIFHSSSNSKKYGLAASLFLAISPWHIMLSRAAFEANVATFLIVSGVWLFLEGVNNKKWCLVLSSALFVMSIYTFNTARIVSPILVLLLAFSFRKRLFEERKKQTLLAFVVGFIMLIPTLGFLFSPQASLRFKEVNIFSDIEVVKRVNQEIENDKNSSWPILHNRRIAYAIEYLKHYFDNLSPSFLFIKGDGNPKFSTQDVGQLYLWDLPFIVIGVLFLFKRKEGFWWIIPLWLLVGIMPAATARETPHALRIETTLPTFQIITAYGFVLLISYINKHRHLIIGCLWILLFLNIVYFLHGYIAHYPHEYSGEWQYGYKQSIEYVKSVQENYDQIRITTKMGRPYIYYAFYTKTDPKLLRKTMVVKRDYFGFVNVLGFSKYRFDDNLSSIKAKTRKILYIDSPSRVHPKGDILNRFYLLNGAETLTAYRL